MAYSTSLAERLRDCLDSKPEIVEKKMFGGLGYLLHGNMMIGVWREFLILRLGKEQAAKALKLKHIKPFDITGKSLTGWVMISETNLEDDLDIKRWLRLAHEFVLKLPAK